MVQRHAADLRGSILSSWQDTKDINEGSRSIRSSRATSASVSDNEGVNARDLAEGVTLGVKHSYLRFQCLASKVGAREKTVAPAGAVLPEPVCRSRRIFRGPWLADLRAQPRDLAPVSTLRVHFMQEMPVMSSAFTRSSTKRFDTPCRRPAPQLRGPSQALGRPARLSEARKVAPLA